MTAPRTLAAAAALLLLLTVTPAFAQSEDEIIGTYRMTVEPQPGSICPPGQADFEVIRVAGPMIEVSLDHTNAVAQWDAGRRSFVGVIPFPDAEHPIQMNGSFSRGPDRVNLVVTVNFPPDRPCQALLSGSIPADPADMTGATGAAASTPTPTTPSPNGPPVFGVAPNGQPPVYGASPAAAAPAGGALEGLANWKLLVLVGVALLIVGLAIGVMRGRSRKVVAVTPAAPPPPAPKPAPPPPPEAAPEPPAPAPKAKPKAPRKPKAKRTEAEDELGEG